MPIPTQDLQAPFDPTNYPSISGAQLLQLINGASPFANTGFFIVTTDIGGNPTVPNASTTTKWQSYGWIRISVTLVSLYIWNPNAAIDATFLQWQSINVAGIGAGSIVNAMIADNTIQDAKIANLSYSKLTGAPSGLVPSGLAGGDLTGTYPNPSINALSITSGKIANNAITHAQLGAQAVQPTTDIQPSGVAFNMLRVNAGATAMEFFVPPNLFTNLNETTIATSGLLPIIVNSAGNGYQYATHNIFGVSLFQSAAVVSTASNLVSLTATPNYNATGMTALFNTGVFNPSSILSKLLIEVSVFVQSPEASTFVGLYNAVGATAPLAGGGIFQTNAGAMAGYIDFKFVTGINPGAATYYLALGTSASTAYMNSIDGANNLFGSMKSSIKITELI